MSELRWGEPTWLTDEELGAEAIDPMERWFWRTFTSWRPATEQEEVSDVAED